MTSNQWLKEKGDYHIGVQLYMAHPKANSNLLRVFNRKHSAANYQKLKYELKKLSKSTVQPLEFTVTTTPLSAPKSKPNQETPGQIPTPAKTTAFNGLHIKDLPVKLHPMYIQQKSDFQLACSLKLQLNALPAENETVALQLCLKIEQLFDNIATAWQVFDYYRKHKTVINLEAPSFTELSATQLIQRRNSKRSSITKAQNRLKTYTANRKLLGTMYAKKQLDRRIQKTEATLLKHKTELTQLNKLIHD